MYEDVTCTMCDMIVCISIQYMHIDHFCMLAHAHGTLYTSWDLRCVCVWGGGGGGGAACRPNKILGLRANDPNCNLNRTGQEYSRKETTQYRTTSLQRSSIYNTAHREGWEGQGPFI